MSNNMDLPDEIRTKLAELDLELSEGKSGRQRIRVFEVDIEKMCPKDSVRNIFLSSRKSIFEQCVRVLVSNSCYRTLAGLSDHVLSFTRS